MPAHRLASDLEQMPSGGITTRIGNPTFLASGDTVPTDGESGYANNCLFILVGTSDDTDALYLNDGTSTSCNFDKLTSALA